MKVTRKIIEIDDELCDGCGLCLPSCAEGALEIIDGKARIIKDLLCDGLGACLGECPNGALKIIEREADEFDEEAVEAHLEQMEKAAPEQEAPKEEAVQCGCPSAGIQAFVPAGARQTAQIPAVGEGEDASELSHWPIQIKLIPPQAPFLKGADLVVVADCVPATYPAFHRDFLKGKAVMMGCPKLDDAQEYIDKFAEVFKTADIKSITVPIIEVPCCSGLPIIVKRGLEASGKEIPAEVVVISIKGKILERAQL
ncbi:MAG: 4Fe-4S ferredoxin [Deltaproteobacteria bacterium]|nr:4Fe-4S ferredoxin [Deltaproteobacteria bacterium]